MSNIFSEIRCKKRGKEPVGLWLLGGMWERMCGWRGERRVSTPLPIPSPTYRSRDEVPYLPGDLPCTINVTFTLFTRCSIKTVGKFLPIIYSTHEGKQTKSVRWHGSFDGISSSKDLPVGRQYQTLQRPMFETNIEWITVK